MTSSILALDVSTSVIGICVLDELTGQRLQSLEFLNLKREKNMFNKALDFKEHISKYKSLNIRHVAIEEPFVAYKHGQSSAHVLSKLSMFNGMVAIICFLVFGVEPTYYNVNHARKLAFPTMTYPQGSNRKMVVWSHVAELFPDVQWLYGPRSGELVKTNFDMADAVVVALAHSISLKEASTLSLD